MSGAQQVLFAPQSEWRPPSFEELPSWKGARRVGLDIETRDPDLGRGKGSRNLGPGVRRDPSVNYIIGIAFTIEDHRSFYLPISHASGNMDRARVLQYLRDQAEVFTGEIVGHNLSYDLDWLAQAGVVFRRAKAFRDTMIAAAVIDELQRDFSLNGVAGRHGLPIKDEALLLEAASVHGCDPKKDMWMLDSMYVGEYGEWDSALPLKLLRRQERIIEDEDLHEVWDLESDVLPVGIRMTRRGVPIDFDRLEKTRKFCLKEEKAALKEIKRLTGVEVPVGGVWTVTQLVPIFDHLGIPVPSTPKTRKASVTTEFLESVDHPVGQLVRRARQVNKLRTTFCTTIEKHAVNGRLHCNLVQMAAGENGGARTGRYAHKNPNLAQIPGSKDPELGGIIRDAFVAEKGALWASEDFSQQEPRIAVHFALEAGIKSALPVARKWRDDPAYDFHGITTELVWGLKKGDDGYAVQRRYGKDIYLGRIYSMGGAKFCKKVGLPTSWWRPPDKDYDIEVAGDEGKELLRRFDMNLPWLGEFTTAVENAAIARGRVVTLCGRHVHFPELPEPITLFDGRVTKYDWTHKAPNGLCQGGAASQMKKAMVDVDREGHHIHLTEHDELDLSVESPKEAEQIREIMQEAVPLNVPNLVTLELGDSWKCSIEK